MSAGLPSRIPIDNDDYHAEHVGRTADGRQFFLTTPFEPAMDGDDDGQEFVALYLFDADGRFQEARIDAFGPRARMDRAARRAVYEARLAELGKVTFAPIEVEPFAVDRFGTTFGLIPREPEGDDDTWWVTVEPGDYMAFSEPWDGSYDT
ncbi:hypothetical protein C1I95_25490 [Micromonospora craterilacus]|uniref:Uncharacterized protein n=1 Tax=Micromonospora craterilacus TaxID=1655439 RepID=A0A2W2FAH9_9ACTN|nr:hypothetical protein [Micromonospora craterilacus]PZG12584.1 hypothetical protein C1I95_25490 [Micromonospora craterilacus]